MSSEFRLSERIPANIAVYFAKKRNKPNETHGNGTAVHGLKAEIARNKGLDPKNLTDEQYDEVCQEWRDRNDRALPARIVI